MSDKSLIRAVAAVIVAEISPEEAEIFDRLVDEFEGSDPKPSPILEGEDLEAGLDPGSTTLILTYFVLPILYKALAGVLDGVQEVTRELTKDTLLRLIGRHKKQVMDEVQSQTDAIAGRALSPQDRERLELLRVWLESCPSHDTDTLTSEGS